MKNASLNSKNIVNSIGIFNNMSFIIAISRNNVGMNNVSCNYSWDEECFLRIVHVNVCIMNISNLVKGPQNTIDIFWGHGTNPHANLCRSHMIFFI